MHRRLPLLTASLSLLVTLSSATLVIAGCGGGLSAAGGGSSPNAVRVVVAENFWGSIASQLAGSKAQVQSIIADPAEDPHSYEPRAADARTLASSQLAIINGLGYDPWAPKLLAANPVPGRKVLTVGDLLGLKQGDNPHRWYNPANVDAVAAAITAELKRLDQHDSSYFAARLMAFEGQQLARYHELLASIKSRYAGVPVGASESIFALLAPALGLKLITPDSFMKAISEGTEVSAQDTAAAQQQLMNRAVKVWIYNTQNATPQIQQLNDIARRQGIPIATVSETLTPADASFEDWQSAQPQRLARALRAATGR